MFLRLGVGEIAFLCIIGALAIALLSYLVYMAAKLNKRLREIEEKLKEK